MSAEERGRLPEGWASAELGDLLTFQYGKALPDRIRTGSGFPVYGSNGIVGRHDKALTQSETIIIGRKGSVGEINYSTGPCSPIDTTYFVDNLWAMPFKYWLHQLKSIDLESLNKATAIPGLNREDAYRVEISLPPLPEQIRIADKLDALLARVEVGRARLERVLKLVKAFRQAVLSAAISGELTREWRGGGEAEWSVTRISDLATDIRYGTSQKCDHDATGIPVLRIPNVSGGQINTDDLKYGKFEERERQKLALLAGDILMIRSNGSADLVGQPALVEREQEGFLFAGYLIRVRLKDSASPRFVWHRLSSPDIRSAIETGARSSSGVHNINAEEIRQITFNLPTLPEQAEIVRRVEALFTLADRLEARYQSAHTFFDRLTPALLAKAFRGELVPQDPNDEPASVLLERIRPQRAAEGSKPKRGRGAALGSAEEPKRQGRPPKAQAEAEEQAPSAEAAAQTPDLQPPRRRGRPPKVRPEAQAQAPAEIPEASSYEDAVRKLEALKLERAGGTRQVSLFELEPTEG